MTRAGLFLAAQVAGHASKHHHAASWSPLDPANRIPLILGVLGFLITFLLVCSRGAS